MLFFAIKFFVQCDFAVCQTCTINERDDVDNDDDDGLRVTADSEAMNVTETLSLLCAVCTQVISVPVEVVAWEDLSLK